MPLLQHRVWLARRSPEQVVEPLVGHGQALAVVEVVHVHAETTVRLEVDEVLVDRVLVDRLAVGAKPISLYSPLFTLKPQ